MVLSESNTVSTTLISSYEKQQACNQMCPICSATPPPYYKVVTLSGVSRLYYLSLQCWYYVETVVYYSQSFFTVL